MVSLCHHRSPANSSRNRHVVLAFSSKSPRAMHNAGGGLRYISRTKREAVPLVWRDARIHEGGVLHGHRQEDLARADLGD